MKILKKILLCPICLYVLLTDGIKYMNKKWKPAMAMLMAVVMLCGMLPATAIAGTNDDEADLLERLGVEGEVQLAELDGGKYIAVYLDDDDSRDSYNNQAAYYAIYDGVWQRPYILEDDGTKDYMPTISDLGNGQLFIAWGTASKTFDANTKEYAALNATDIVGVFVDKATGNISEVLEVTYETEDDVLGDENPRAAYDEATGRLMIWYSKCEYSDESDPYFVLSYRLYDMRVKEFLDMGDSPDGDWYGQVLVGVNPVVTVEETLDASGYWAETPEFTVFEGWGGAVEFDAIQFNGQSLLAYVIDYDFNRSTTDDRDVYVLAYNFEDDSIIHPIMITNTDAGESNVEFRDVDGKLCLSYLSDGQKITFNISDNFSNVNVLREDVTDDGVFYYYISKSADSGYIPATVAAFYKVTFDANGGTGTMYQVYLTENMEYALPENGFTAPSNKAFKAWSVGGEEKQPGDKITISADTTVTAVWEILHTCSITPVEKVWPSCENGGKEAYYKCEGCGKFFEDANGTTEIANIETWGNLPKNGHDYGTEWKSDEDNHWNECACGDKANTAAHKDENTDGKCDVCAYNVGLPTTPDDGNKPSDNPQTGDNTPLGLWIALLIVSSFGIVAITLFGKKKYFVR